MRRGNQLGPRDERLIEAALAPRSRAWRCGRGLMAAFVTDGGHLILDASLKRIADPGSLANRLCAIPGVVEHGLFIGMANVAILAGSDGIRVVTRP